MENRIKALRVKKALTQSDLAKKVGTSQQQIHRIESGYQSVRFDLAINICSALGVEIERVFPKSRKPLMEWRKKNSKIDEIYSDENLKTSMKSAHIDMDPLIWIFKYLLRGEVEGEYVISGIDKDRLFKGIQIRDSSTPYTVFDTEYRRIALNLNHLLFCHFLYEAPLMDTGIREEEPTELRIYLSTNKSPICFGIDPDNEKPDDPDHDKGQFRDLLYTLETVVEGDDIFSFMDEDGETAFFRAMDVSLIEVPLWAIEGRADEEG